MAAAVRAGAGAIEARIDEVAGLLGRVVAEHAPAVLASSFGAEDMVLVDLIARRELPIAVATLDTGRLHEATHALMETVRGRYGIEIEVVLPEAAAVEAFVRAEGPNAFYRSVALRQRCCTLRKVLPLRRLLAGRRAWITGQRRQQALTRRGLALEEWDAAHGLHKVNPLAAWTTDEVWAYVERFAVPTSPLHLQGYASIGCAPCTRPITPGEDLRAGRWWWEEPEGRECGLHPGRRAAPQPEGAL